MPQSLFHITLWRTAITEFSKEIGYAQQAQGMVNQQIAVELHPEPARLVACVHLECSTLNYEISSTHDCLDFCQLLKAIENLRGG
ncbi:hypothetical protein [Vibrio harveyi]